MNYEQNPLHQTLREVVKKKKTRRANLGSHQSRVSSETRNYGQRLLKVSNKRQVASLMMDEVIRLETPELRSEPGSP